ncbi:hypothetical protein [Deinococcus hopiensis]|nr:hypothetical protein [Deinococcus hopiensis]
MPRWYFSDLNERDQASAAIAELRLQEHRNQLRTRLFSSRR